MQSQKVLLFCQIYFLHNEDLTESDRKGKSKYDGMRKLSEFIFVPQK